MLYKKPLRTKETKNKFFGYKNSLYKKNIHSMNNLKDTIKIIEDHIEDPQIGLPDDIFYFIGRLTPFINVDLLIKCPERGVILTWREDEFSGEGWHIPGGIIRFRESIQKRIFEVGKKELGVKILDFKGPLSTNEIILKKQVNRSHFISLLYKCEISKNEIDNLYVSRNKKISFFKKKPTNLLELHEIYKDLF